MNSIGDFFFANFKNFKRFFDLFKGFLIYKQRDLFLILKLAKKNITKIASKVHLTLLNLKGFDKGNFA